MKIEKEKSLKELTTFKIGGPARFFCSVTTETELLEALDFADKEKVSIFVLGGGSNILVSDDGYPGLVIHMNMKGVEFIKDEYGNERVMIKAGENWDELVETTVGRGLYGLENLSLIPGTVGAAPVQNIGAYGSEVKDTIDIVRAYDLEKKAFIDLTNFDCKFEYRSSIFKKNTGKFIIVSVTFVLKETGKLNIEYKDLKEYFSTHAVLNPTLKDVRTAVVTIRTNKLPDVTKIGTAGSFFKNPSISHAHAQELKANYPDLPVYPVDDAKVKVSLAWIIDHVCGYKGVMKGEVGTYKNQALVLVNNGNAKAEEIIFFAEEIKKIVKEKTGIEIENEVQFIS